MPPRTLRGLSDLWGIALPNDRGLSLGADVPVCLASRATRMQGIGNQLTDVNFLPQMPAVLVNSGDAVSTPTIFSSLDNKANPEIDFLPNGPLNFDDAIEYLAQQRNDLEKPAIAHAPKHRTCVTGAIEKQRGLGAYVWVRGNLFWAVRKSRLPRKMRRK